MMAEPSPRWSAVVGAIAILLFNGCQSIPTRPLALRESLEALKTLEIAPEPVLDYAVSLGCQSDAEARPFSVADGLSLAELEAVALRYNPDLLVSRLEAQQAGAVAAASGRWEDPGLDMTGGRKREEFDGIERSWITGATLSITLPLSGRVSAEREAASAELDSALRAVAEQEWTTLGLLRDEWLVWSASVERTRLLDEHLALLLEFADVARSLAAAGELDPGSARMFSIERAQKQAQRESAAYREAGQRAALLGRAGLLPDAPVTLTPCMLNYSDAASTAVNSASAALDHPVVARLAADYEVAEARLRLELRKQYPDLVISPAYGKEGGESSITLGLGLVPIPVWSANKPAIADAAASRDIARARVEGKVQQVLSEIAEAQAQLAGAKSLREGLLAGAATEADLQMQEARALLRVGEADMGMVFQALTQVYGIKQELLEATLEEQRALVRLRGLKMPNANTTPHDETVP